MYRMHRKRKLIAVLLLAVFFILTASSLALADQPSPLLNNSDIQQYNQQNPPSYGEKFIAGIIAGAVKWLMNEFYIDDPTVLVFGQDPRTDKKSTFLANGVYGSLLATPDQVVMGIFPMYFFKAVAILYDGFTKLLPIPLVLILAMLGILFMVNSGTTEGRNKIKDYVQAFFTALVTLRFGAYIWTAIITLIHFIIKLIWAYMMKAGVSPAFFMDMVWGGGKAGFTSATQMGSLPLTILVLMATMMVLSLNYQYVMRLITLGVLILIFPIVTTASTYPGYRHSLQTWMKEFVANAILPLAHALAFGAFFILLIMPGVGRVGAFWLMLAYFAGLPAVTGLIRELLGLPGGVKSGLMGAASGMAGVAALGGIVGMLKGHKPEGQHSEGGGSSETNSGSSGSGGGSSPSPSPRLSGATSFTGKMAQGAFNGASAVLRNKLVQGGLKAAGRGALGITAATAGAALSTMTTGSATSGAMVGAKAGTTLNRHAGNLVGGLSNGAQTVAQSISEYKGVNPKDIGSRFVQQSMQKGGVLAGANWGLQSAVNKVSTAMGKSEVFSAPSFIKENKDALRTAQSSMHELRPQMDLSQAKYEQSLNHLGPDNQKTKDLQEQYQGMKSMYDSHEADAFLAQTKLRSPSELQRHTATFSPSRGRLD